MLGDVGVQWERLCFMSSVAAVNLEVQAEQDFGTC